MKKLQDLMAAATVGDVKNYDFKSTKVQGDPRETIGGIDHIARYYNNIFGSISTTHMAYIGDLTWVVTGLLVDDPKQFYSFLTSTNWGGYSFDASSIKVSSLENFMQRYHLVGTFGTYNGGNAFIIYQLTEEKAAAFLDDLKKEAESLPPQEREFRLSSLKDLDLSTLTNMLQWRIRNEETNGTTPVNYDIPVERLIMGSY